MTQETKIPSTIRLTADQIEHRCEVHDELLAALEVAQARLRACYSHFSHPYFTDRFGDAETTKLAFETVEKALAKAKAGAA